ncbi:unnamed protein product [Porites evermanni]|uniref:Uncharacterized protein n=1 Tax=Porites evermanni TaxID=104178 RepID=A0ABN8Q4M8_9CNID|nr:unnamed protein product [Porites evermanni]
MSGMPSKYVFHLFLCYQPSCIHPSCKLGAPPKEETWYEGGPPLSFTPLPVADPNRSYGNPACADRKGKTCAGH